MEKKKPVCIHVSVYNTHTEDFVKRNAKLAKLYI